MRIRFSLLRFVRFSRTDPSVQSPGDVPPPLPPKIDAQPDCPDYRSVLLQWQRLGSLDPKSPHYVELLERLVDVEGNRSLALEFTGDDAGIIINIIGGVSSSNPS